MDRTNSTNPDAGNSRRSFIKNSASAAALLLVANEFAACVGKNTAVETAPGLAVDNNAPWYKRVTRWGQINITEKDPAQYDIGWWRKYWKRTSTKGVVVNAGGIVAYYPTKVPLHKTAEFLNGRDLFGELCRAAHEDGVAVFARMDSNRAHEEFYKAHPDWFAVDASGKPYKAADLYISCINSPYYSEHLPAVLKEIATLYHPEGFTDNSWSGLGRNSICYCGYCKKSFKEKTGNELPVAKDWNDKVYKQWIRWSYDRRLEIWDLNNRVTKAAGGPHCIWSGMNSGSISGQSRSFRDFRKICERADIIMLDDQARSDSDGFQHNGEIGKLIHGMLGWDKLLPESMAMYQAHKPWFRVASKPLPEARMWVVNGIAGGIQLWWHMVGAYHEDRRMYHNPEKIFLWHQANEEYLINRRPVATVGLVWSQENTDFYGRDASEELVEQPWRGMSQALTRARIPYLPVHADHIDRDAASLSTLILPNLVLITDAQVEAIRRFVEKGGSLIATGDTGLFSEWGEPRSDYALADLFGVHLIKQRDLYEKTDDERMAGAAYHTYLRLTPELRAQMDGPHKPDEPAVSSKRHEIFKGFEETDIIPFGGQLQPIKTDAGAEVLLTFVPQFPVYPPEKAWMREPSTDIPGLILRNHGKGGRMVFIPADLDRQFGKFNLPDHGNLLKNIVQWAAKDSIPLSVEGLGLVDSHLYRQQNRMILHLVNLTNQNTWRQPLDELVPAGPFKVKVKLPDGVKGTNLRLLVSDQAVTPQISGGWATFEIKSILDHEVVVIA